MTDQPGPEPPGGAPPPALGPPPGSWAPTPPMAPKPARPRSTSGRSAGVVLLIIVGVLLGANLVNAALPLPADPVPVDPGPAFPVVPEPTGPAQPGASAEPEESLTPIRSLPPLDPGPVEAGDPVEVGAGFTITPPDGWTIVGGEDGLTVLQKGGILLIVGGFAWPGTPTELAEAYRDGWFADGEFSADDAQTGEIGNGIPAAIITYSGVVGGSTMDGAIVAGAIDGDGFVFNVFGSAGSLDAVSDDLDAILATVGHAGG